MSSAKLTAGLFGLFLVLFLVITFISRRTFAPGEGLGPSVGREAIVQFVVRSTSAAALGVDARPERPAARVPYDSPVVQKILLRNLSQEKKIEELHVQVEPAELADSVRWSMPWPVKLTMAPGEEKSLPLAFLVSRDKFKTKDGVLSFRITY